MGTPQSFRILKIAAYSDLPVRNSIDQLAFGHHILWENGYATDGDNGSLKPNAFAYDFVSPVASSASFDVTIKPTDGELVGKEYRLYGHLDSDTTTGSIFESDFFCIKSLDAITIEATVVKPNISAQPFSWTGDFTWIIEQKSTNQKVACAHPTATRLELYWISSDINAIFLTGHSGIPVELLRTAIPKITTPYKSAPNPNWATRVAFYSYNKVYDAVRGAPHFGVSYHGGTFRCRSYIYAKPGHRPGTFQRIVNCYDQAAMVQVVQSLGPAQRPTWLYQKPYGYILPTNLIGWGHCNNPFFRSNNTPKMIGRDDWRRTAFGNHAFNGIPGRTLDTDRIYDACGGPHLGDLPQTYQNTAIDRTTFLSNSVNTGNINNVTKYNGVTGTTFAAGATTLAARATIETPSKGVEDLIQKSVAINPNTRSFSQLHWGNVPQWIKSVLGENCEVAFHEFRIESTGVDVVWYLSGVDHGGEDDTIVLDVKTNTSIGSDGNLDLTKSCNMAIDNLRYELKNTEMDLGPNDEVLDTLWVPAPFGEHTQHAVQYASGIPSGRVLISSGNCTINLYGGPSSSSLESIVNKILSHTTFRGDFPVHIPNVTEHRFNIPEVTRGHASNVVQGIGSSFEVHCDLPHSIAAATAHVLEYGLLLNDYTVENAAAEGISTVIFRFVTRKIGTHDVDLRFASAPALTSITKRIQVEVIEA